jgi:hypothetical protein
MPCTRCVAPQNKSECLKDRYGKALYQMNQQRNARCACGSGLKYKKCCLPRERTHEHETRLALRAEAKRRVEESERVREENARRPGPSLVESGTPLDPVTLKLAAHAESFPHGGRGRW